MSRIHWLRDYCEQTGCDLHSAMRAWDRMAACMGEHTKLRDAAAFAALQGLLSYGAVERPTRDEPEHWHVTVAREAFLIADAFIAAREEGEE